jgi:hypothetical protein
MTIVTPVGGCADAYPGDGTRDGGGQGEGDGWAARQRLMVVND